LNLDHWETGQNLCSVAERNYSGDKANLGYARGAAYEQAMAAIYTACLTVLRPVGILAKETARAS
jgi:hypothetical protein